MPTAIVPLGVDAMTVAELIALLATMPQDAEVVMLDTDAYPSYVAAVAYGKACEDDTEGDKVLLTTKWS